MGLHSVESGKPNGPCPGALINAPNWGGRLGRVHWPNKDQWTKPRGPRPGETGGGGRVPKGPHACKHAWRHDNGAPIGGPGAQ